uniref:Uncharacterized protein n=1 Tax=Vitis vinifera TaxID=29760 RepID=F6HZT5_VITVI
MLRENVRDGGDDRSGVRCNGGRWMGMMRKGSWEDDSNVHRLDRRGQLFGLKSQWKWASQAELRRSLKLRSSETYDALESVCIGLRSIIWGTSSC